MQAPGFVCRSCLARIQRQCQIPRQVRLARRLNHSTSTQLPSLAQRTGEFESTLPRESVPRSAGNLLPRNGALRTYRNATQPSNKASRRASSAAGEAQDPERGFDPANYSAEDQEFWDKYDQIWNASVAPEESAPPQDSSGQDTGSTTIEHVRASKPKSKRWWGQRPQDRQTELNLAVRDAPDKKRARKRYNVWKKQFSYIWRATQDGKPLPTTGMPSDLKWLLRSETVEAMREAWHLQPLGKRDAKWIHVMLGALRFTPQKAHLVLEAILESEHRQVAPFYAISDTLCLLAQRSSLDLPGEDKEELAKSLADLVILVLQTIPPESFLLRQNTLYHILAKVRGKRLADLYGALRACNHPLHTNTLLQFARFLAKDVDYKTTSLGIMQELAESRSIDINSPHGAALCTSILSVSEEDAVKELRATPAQLFEVLLELGLEPNIITYTTIIRNLCLNKELKVAWEVFDIMQQHQIEADLHVYSVLLNGAKLCEDFESISRVLHLAKSHGVGGPILWNDVIHSILLLYMSEARSRRVKRPWVLPAFQAMFRAYASVYRTVPLQTFALSDIAPLLRQPIVDDTADGGGAGHWQTTNAKAQSLIDHLHAWRPEERLEPAGDTLGLMLIGYISGFSQVYNIIAFYSRFRSMLKSGNPVAVRFVQEKGTLLHDIVIKAVVEWPGMLRVALDVVSDMLKDSIASASTLHASRPPTRGDTARHPAPSIYTWNILLNGFMHHKHLRQGERILAMMREHRLEPDVVSWNTLLAGYARTQRVAKSVDALQRLERAGFRADEYTMRGFSYLNNQKAAVEMMEGIVERRREKQELAALRERLGVKTPEESIGVEAALRDMEMVVDEVAGMTGGPTIRDVGTEDYEWEEPEKIMRHTD